MRMPTGWQEGFHTIKPVAIPIWAVTLGQNNVDIDVSAWYLNQCQRWFLRVQHDEQLKERSLNQDGGWVGQVKVKDWHMISIPYS